MGDHREGQGAANGATLLDSDGFCTAVAVSLMEEEKTQTEKHNEQRLVKEHIQENDHIYSDVFDPPRDGNCLMAVTNHGVVKTPSEVHGTERNQGVFLS